MSAYVDGVDLATHGVTVWRRAGDHTPAVAAPPGLAVPGRPGVRLTGAAAAVAPRRITVDATLRVSQRGALVAALRTLVAALTGRAGGNASRAVQLSFSPAYAVAPDVAFTAHLDDDTAVELSDAQELATEATLRLVFTCPDPNAYALAATTFAVSTGSVTTAVGTARSAPVITLDGPRTSGVPITITLRAVDSGTSPTIATCEITPGVAIGSGETIVVDTAAGTVAHVVAGVATPHADWLSAGDFLWLDPGDLRLGAPGALHGLKLSAGDGVVTFRRAYR